MGSESYLPRSGSEDSDSEVNSKGVSKLGTQTFRFKLTEVSPRDLSNDCDRIWPVPMRVPNLNGMDTIKFIWRTNRCLGYGVDSSNFDLLSVSGSYLQEGKT